MKNSLATFIYEIKRDMKNVEEVLRRTAYHAADSAIVKIVNDSKIWSGSFIASNRVGINQESPEPPTDMKIYFGPMYDDGVSAMAIKFNPKVKGKVQTSSSPGEISIKGMPKQGGAIKALPFGDNHIFVDVMSTGTSASSRYPAKLTGPAATALRQKVLSELRGQLVANRKNISPFGKIYLTNNVTDSQTGDYAIEADHYSKNIYEQSRRVAVNKAQEEFNKVIKLDKVASL